MAYLIISTVFSRSYLKTSNVAAENSYESEQGVLEKRILEVFVFKQNAAQAHKRLSPKGLPLKWAPAAFALAGIGLQHTHCQSRLASTDFRANGDFRGFEIASNLFATQVVGKKRDGRNGKRQSYFVLPERFEFGKGLARSQYL